MGNRKRLTKIQQILEDHPDLKSVLDAQREALERAVRMLVCDLLTKKEVVQMLMDFLPADLQPDHHHLAIHAHQIRRTETFFACRAHRPGS